jgi:glutamyl-tRNA reductase
MQVFVVGLNHKSAAIAVRERYAIAEADREVFLQRGSRLPHVEELVALSTCNRVELYGASRHPQSAARQLIGFLAESHGGNREELEPHTYYHEGSAAVAHGMKVASSLDSLILGEAQILGQVKEAYRFALDAGTTGGLTNKFFHQVFYTAKRVRTETGIGAHPVSVSYAAVVLAKQIFGDLKDKKALIIGAGKMSGLALKHLKSAGIQTFYLCNRTEQKALQMARQYGGEVIPFSNFEKWLADVDVVITSTNSPQYLIDAAMVTRAFKGRKGAPVFFIDIAVPRDVSPEVNQLSHVFLYDVDDLGAVVEANKETRVVEAEKALAIVDQEVQAFHKTLKAFAVVPTLSSLSKKIEKICDAELEKAFLKMPHLDADGREVVQNMASAIVKKILHDPMVTLKQEQWGEEPADYVALVRKLFRLEENS